MRLRDLIFISVIVGGGLALARGSLKPVVSGYWPSAGPQRCRFARSRRRRLECLVSKAWDGKGLHPSPPADAGGHAPVDPRARGTIPSLEEIRQFEARPPRQRLEGFVTRPAPRPPHGRLPGRAVRPCPGRNRGRTVHPVSAATIHDLAFRCDPGQSSLRCRRPRPGSRPGALDRSSGHQFHFRDVQRGGQVSRPRASGRAGFARVPGGANRLRPVPRPSVPALETGRFPWSGRLLRRRRFQPARHYRSRELVPAGRPQDEKGRQGGTACAVSSRVASFRGHAAAGLPAGSQARPTPAWRSATVNRMWAILFGRPLVEPVDDLPGSGELPLPWSFWPATSRRGGPICTA